MGLPAASIYMLALMLFIPFPFTVNSAMGVSKTGPFPHEEVHCSPVDPRSGRMARGD
jgi:hypothetical protein